MKRCSSCQRLAASRFQYCPSCGAKFPDAEAQKREEAFFAKPLDFRDWELPEEGAAETPSPRRTVLSDSALRLLLCALAVVFLIAAISFVLLLLKAHAPPSQANEYADVEETANVITETDASSPTDAEFAPVPAATPFQAPSSAPVQTPGRSSSTPVTTPYPAVTPAPLPRP